MKNRIIVFSSEISCSSGGIENTTYYLLKAFSSFGYQVLGFVNKVDEDFNDFESVSLNEDSLLKRIIKGVKIFKKMNPKEGLCLCLNWRFAIVPYLCKSTYIVMAHGNDVVSIPNPSFRAKVENVLRKRILNRALRVCANSHYTADLVKQIRDKDEPIIIHPCSGEMVNKNEVTVDNKIILSLGRLEERKGFQYVIEAFSKLSQVYPEYHYYIAGDGPFRKNLEELIEKYKLNNKCQLLGRIKEEEKQELLRTCSMLVMPSFFNKSIGSVEGFGIVFIEANSHGKPVIGTKSGGIEDAIINNRTGLLVEEKNSNQLSEAIVQIIDGKTNISKDYCMEWAEKHYYIEIAKQYIELFEMVSNNKGLL